MSNDAERHNKAIVLEARDLYLRLLAHASAQGWRNLHLLARVGPIPSDLEWADGSWYKAQVLVPVRTALLRAKIVRTASGTLAPMIGEDGKKFMWFPSAPKGPLRELRGKQNSAYERPQPPKETGLNGIRSSRSPNRRPRG